jgi:hypothetical protein
MRIELRKHLLSLIKHGRYAAKAIARRREISGLIRAARALEASRL